MPELCRFFGIVMAMYAGDHPPSHFHARYGEYEGVIIIEQVRLAQGELPPRVLGMVLEWTALHRRELLANWQALCNDKPMQSIEPLR